MEIDRKMYGVVWCVLVRCGGVAWCAFFQRDGPSSPCGMDGMNPHCIAFHSIAYKRLICSSATQTQKTTLFTMSFGGSGVASNGMEWKCCDATHKNSKNNNAGAVSMLYLIYTLQQSIVAFVRSQGRGRRRHSGVVHAPWTCCVFALCCRMVFLAWSWAWKSVTSSRLGLATTATRIPCILRHQSARKYLRIYSSSSVRCGAVIPVY